MSILYDLLDKMIGKINSCVKTVNGVAPDASGNVEVAGGSGEGGGGGTPNAVQYVPQTLTDAQKTQARTNIGAGVPVTIDSSLTTTGAAADAKTVGDRFSAVNENLDMAIMSGPLMQDGALTWNGVIGDREYVVAMQEGPMLVALVRVSEDVVNVTEALLETPVLQAFGILESVPFQEVFPVPLSPMGGGAYATEGFFLVPSDNFVLPGGEMPIVFPKAGVYTMLISFSDGVISLPMQWGAGLWIPGYSFSSGGGGASKYFEKTTSIKHVGDTLTWDGEIGGRVYGEATTSNDQFTSTTRFVKVSDITPSMEEIADAADAQMTINNGSGEDEVYGSLTTEEFDGGMGYSIGGVPIDGSSSIILKMIHVVSAAPVTISGVTLSEPGVYFLDSYLNGSRWIYTASFTIPGYDFIISSTDEIIKTEHLPEALRFGEIETEIRGDTLTWDGNASGLVGIEGTHFRVSDAIPSPAQLQAGGTVTRSDGELLTFSAPSETQNGLSSIAGLVYVLHQNITYGEYTYPAGVYLAKGVFYISSFTINGYDGFVTKDVQLVTIDPKYLPAGIGGGGGGSALPPVTTSDAGKFLRVSSSGAWAVEAVPNAEGARF